MRRSWLEWIAGNRTPLVLAVYYSGTLSVMNVPRTQESGTWTLETRPPANTWVADAVRLKPRPLERMLKSVQMGNVSSANSSSGMKMPHALRMDPMDRTENVQPGICLGWHARLSSRVMEQQRKP